MIARAGPPSVHALGLAGVAAALLGAAALLPMDLPPLSLFACPFRAATGWPCLACGCTHAFHHFVRGEFAAAFLSSPLGTSVALAAAAHLLWTALRIAGLPYAPRLKMTPRLRWAAAAALAANWAFLVVRA